MDPGMVVAIIQRGSEALAACLRSSASQGSIVGATVEVTINPAGVPTAAKSDVASACVTAVLRKLKFARPRDGKPATVSLKLVYHEHPMDPDLPGGGPKPQPSITIGAPSVRDPENLDPAIIARLLRRGMSALHACYADGLHKHDTLAGTVKAEFTIAADGTVSAAHASGLHDAATETCVAGAIKALTFPRPAHGEQPVTCPITLAPP
jgi:hypothetical protein